MKLYVTYCSWKKREGILSPDKLYDSPRIDKFTEYCKRKNVSWAILSAKYGLFFPDKKRGSYNVTLKTDSKFWLGIKVIIDDESLPKDKSDIILKELTEKVRTQANAHMVEQVVFYTWSLMQPKCYLAVLHHVLDNCNNAHSWSELLDHIEQYGRIDVTTQLGCGK